MVQARRGEWRGAAESIRAGRHHVLIFMIYISIIIRYLLSEVASKLDSFLTFISVPP